MLTQSASAPYLIWHAKEMGCIARYDQDYAVIGEILSDLRLGGAGGISLSPWLEPNAPTLGNADQYLDFTGGVLAPQMQLNFERLLASIKAHGFDWVQIAPQFYGANNPRTWTAWEPYVTDSLYAQNWIFLASLPALCDAAGLEYLIDLCPEVNDVYKTNPVFQQYAKRLWVDATGWFYPNGRPPWRLSMSFVPRDLDVLTDLWQGNPPPIGVPHVYANYPGGLGAGLRSVNTYAPEFASLVVGETNTLQSGDEPVAQDLVNAIEFAASMRIQRVCPWPITTAWKEGDPSITVYPPAAPALWKAVGA